LPSRAETCDNRCMKKIPLYDGTIVLCMDERKHIYWVEGRKDEILCNATGVLKVMAKPFLIPWAAKMASEHWRSQIQPGKEYGELALDSIFDEAKTAHKTYTGGRGKIGSHVHDWIEKYINYEMGLAEDPPKYPISPDLARGVDAFLAWMDEKGDVEWMFSERVTYHPGAGHCGTVDAVYKYQDKYYIVDFKTGSGVWPEAALQCASYAAALAYEFDWDLDDCCREIVHLNVKTGKHKTYSEGLIRDKLTGHGIKADYDTFRSALYVYKWIMAGPNKWAFLKS